LGRNVVAQRRVVGDPTKIPHSVDAAQVRLELGDLLHLVVDLGDSVDNLLHGLNEVGDIDNRDSLRRRGATHEKCEQRCCD
jgi:hypothetical protein